MISKDWSMGALIESTGLSLKKSKVTHEKKMLTSIEKCIENQELWNISIA